MDMQSIQKIYAGVTKHAIPSICVLVACSSVIAYAALPPCPYNSNFVNELDILYPPCPHNSNFVNELDIFYPMRRVLFDAVERFDRSGRDLGEGRDLRDLNLQRIKRDFNSKFNDQSPNPLDVLALRSLARSEKMRDGVDTMMDRLLSIRRLG